MPKSYLHAAIAATEREQLLFVRQAQGVESAVPFPDKLGAIKQALSVFERSGVPYALIGGLAVGVRSGVPRATLDVDFAIPTAVDRAALSEQFTAAGFRANGAFTHSINFEHPSGEPVQLAFDASFDAMISRAEVLTFGDLSLCVVTKADLLTMKRQASTDPKRRRSKALRDQADIALLEGDVPEPNEGW
ncbi:MAG TPA: hypothetical protein VL137_13540 [Polyangiaceae bacterium]|nr:hypothetical protein [Polyangiaceae bacterium]